MARPEEWTKERIEVEADALLEWAKFETSIVLGEFPVTRDPPYTKQTMYDLAEKNDMFSYSLKVAKGIVASRREKGGLAGVLNSHIVAKTMGFYDLEYKDHEKEMKQAERSAQAQSIAEGLSEFKKVIDDVQEGKVEKPAKKPVKKRVAKKKPVKRVKKKK